MPTQNYSYSIKFYLRDMISHIIGLYIQWMQDDGASENQIKLVQGVMQSFQQWLFNQTQF